MSPGAKAATSAPSDALTRFFRPGKKPNRKGVLVPVLDRPERCTNCRLQHLYGRVLCGVCQMTCPDQAIRFGEEKPGETP